MSDQSNVEKFGILCRALCDVENQPHQWMGHPTELELEIVKLFGCPKLAEWEIIGKRPDDSTYSCTEHLSMMLSDETIEIVPHHNERDQCCFLMG